jgi:hypothetical protein
MERSTITEQNYWFSFVNLRPLVVNDFEFIAYADRPVSH